MRPPSPYVFLTRPVGRITFPKFEPDRSNLKFDLDLDPVRPPSPYVFLTRPVGRITFPKFEPDRSNLKFDLDLDPGDLTNANSFFLGQSYTHPPSLRGVGPMQDGENRR